jgi:hypothetical protein
MTPHRKGAIAETRIAAELTRLGLDVYRPIAEGAGATTCSWTAARGSSACSASRPGAKAAS